MKVDSQQATSVLQLITGGWRAQAFYTAIKLGLPDMIEAGKTTSAELAEATGAKEQGIRRLMRFLVAVGVFTGDSRLGFANTMVGTAVLDRPGSMRDMCLLYGEEFYAAWGQAHESLSTVRAGFEIAYGKPLYTYLAENQGASDRFQRAMKAGNLFFEHVPDIFDFSGKRVVDIGGGNGELLAAILAATPNAHGTLLDQKHVVAAARRNLSSTIGLARVEIVGGNMFDGVPAGGDVYVLCRVLAGHSDEAVVALFASIRRALADTSSKLLLLDRLVEEQNSHWLPALWDLHLLMTTGGRHRSLDELRTLLDRAGLFIERIADLPMETTALIAAPESSAR